MHFQRLAILAALATLLSACGPTVVQPVPGNDAGPIPTGACFDGKGGAPEVFVVIVKAEAGPQGGHHVWVGVRMKNLGQNLTRTILRGEAPTLGVKIPETAVVFSYGPDEGGYCKLFGVRYQFDLDAAGRNVDYTPFLGKPLNLEVELIDQGGRSAKKTLKIVLADSL
jgi:hypothetical protein